MPNRERATAMHDGRSRRPIVPSFFDTISKIDTRTMCPGSKVRARHLEALLLDQVQKSFSVDKAARPFEHQHDKEADRKRPHSWLYSVLTQETMPFERKWATGMAQSCPWCPLSIAPQYSPDSRRACVVMDKAGGAGIVLPKVKNIHNKRERRRGEDYEEQVCEYLYVSPGESRKCMHHPGKR